MKSGTPDRVFCEQDGAESKPKKYIMCYSLSIGCSNLEVGLVVTRVESCLLRVWNTCDSTAHADFCRREFLTARYSRAVWNLRHFRDLSTNFGNQN